MTAIKRLFLSPIGTRASSGAVIPAVMTSVGVSTFVAGVLYMPTLAPTRVEMIGLLLLLACFALLSHGVGQLTAILERLNGRS